MPMNKTLELFRKRLLERLTPHGAVAEFCRISGISRSSVQRWEEGAAPTLDLLEPIARGLGTTPWELLKPEAAASAVKPTRESLLGSIILRIAGLNQDELGSVVHALEAIEGLRATTEALQLRKKLK